MCLTQGPQRSDAGEAPRSRVMHSTTEPPRSISPACRLRLGCGPSTYDVAVGGT